MYSRYAKKKGWDVQLMDVVRSDLGGLKYGTVVIEGEDVYKFLKFETGAHRVQRVPVTEASGRIQTSIATVAVLPVAEDVEVEINPQDVRTDTYSAGGPGGQHVNKTQSAVRLTHIPTNIVVQCQDQRSQTRNRELAWKALKSKLYEHFEELKARERRDLRRTQVGTGDRSDKIRTYNFPDSRITDTRLGASGSVHNLEGFLQGEMDELMDRLLKWEREEKLKALAKKKGWDVQLMDVVRSDLGGLKYGTIAIEGEDVYKFLKFETGAHRVQRVPVTEASGRIQTSIATVAVLPQAEDVEIDINPQDVRTDTYSAGGPGGQHVNKTQSAVRLTHIPTNIVVQCQDQRSQTRNRELAWKALKTKLYEHFEELKARERRDLRRTKVGTGDRSDKIRTYNFPDSRVTDVRLGASGSVHNLEGFLQGEMDELMDRLLKFERDEKLKALAKQA